MTRTVVTAFATALTLLATEATANWNINAKLLCYDTDSQDEAKILKEKGDNETIIAWCLDVDFGDPLIDNYALTYDSDTRELHVINRCDDSIVECDFSNERLCRTSSQKNDSGFKTSRVCTHDLLTIGTAEVEGSMLCIEKEKYSFSSNRFTFSASCTSTLDLEGLPCVLAFKTGKLFEESEVCPTAQ